MSWTDLDLAKAVEVHATKNYEKDGWDYVVETMCAADIIQEIEDCRKEGTTIESPEQAIAALLDLVTLLNDRREDIQGMADDGEEF